MVTEFGMSDRLGPVRLGRKQHEVFLGRDIMEDRNYSEEIAYAIDQELRSIIDDCYKIVRTILTEQGEALKEVTKELLAREVLEGDELDKLLEGVEAKKGEGMVASEGKMRSNLKADAPKRDGWRPSVEPA